MRVCHALLSWNALAASLRLMQGQQQEMVSGGLGKLHYSPKPITRTTLQENGSDNVCTV